MSYRICQVELDAPTTERHIEAMGSKSNYFSIQNFLSVWFCVVLLYCRPININKSLEKSFSHVRLFQFCRIFFCFLVFYLFHFWKIPVDTGVVKLHKNVAYAMLVGRTVLVLYQKAVHKHKAKRIMCLGAIDTAHICFKEILAKVILGMICGRQ